MIVNRKNKEFAFFLARFNGAVTTGFALHCMRGTMQADA
jgi:hypothetical protein